MDSLASDDTNEVVQQKPILPKKSKFFKKKSAPLQEYKKLEIHLVDSKVLKQGEKITITPHDINGVKHNLEDSFTFGREDETNDFNFPTDDKIGTKQFKIKYDESYNSYTIRDCYLGTGLFIHINGRQLIEDNHIICFSNNQFAVSIDNKNCLKIRFIKGEFKGREIKIDPEEMSFVSLGRSKKSHIVFDDVNVSRFQCTFVYDDYNWFLYDGKPGQSSTNGIWLLANKPVNMKNGLLFKTGYSTFVARMY